MGGRRSSQDCSYIMSNTPWLCVCVLWQMAYHPALEDGRTYRRIKEGREGEKGGRKGIVGGKVMKAPVTST